MTLYPCRSCSRRNEPTEARGRTFSLALALHWVIPAQGLGVSIGCKSFELSRWVWRFGGFASWCCFFSFSFKVCRSGGLLQAPGTHGSVCECRADLGMRVKCSFAVPTCRGRVLGTQKHVQKWRVLECGNRARTDASTDASSWLLSVFLFSFFLNLQNCESSGLLVTVAVRLCCCGLSLSLCQGVTRSSRGRRVCEPGPGLRACSTDFTKDRSKSIRNPQGLNHRPPQHKSPDTSKPSRPKRRACWHDGCFLQPGPAVDAQEVQRLNSGFRAPGT